MKQRACITIVCLCVFTCAGGCSTALTRLSTPETSLEQPPAAAGHSETAIVAAASEAPEPVFPEPADAPAPSPAVPDPEPAPAGPDVMLLPQPPVKAPERTGEKISLNFDNADIYEVINALSDFLNINYIIDPAVKGKVNIHTTGEIDRSQLLPIFETIFKMNNIALVQQGELHKIVPIKEAREEISEIHIGRTMVPFTSHDRVMVQIVPLHYVPAAEVAKVLKSFSGKRGDIIEYPAGNLLIIIDSAAMIHTLLQLVNIIDIDTFANTTVGFFKVRNVEAKDVAKELEDIFAATGIAKTTDKGVGIKFIPIDRISSILTISSIPGIFEKVQHWVELLDAVDMEAEEQIFIYFAENGKAGEIAEVLNKVYGEGKEGGSTAVRRTPAPAQKGAAEAAAVTGSLLEGKIKIVTDETTNSIIVRATPYDYNIIKKTIQQLDIIPKQVLIEVLIAEVTLSGDTEFGVEWSLLSDTASLGGYKGRDRIGVDYGSGGLGTDLASNLGRGFTYRFDSNRLKAFLVAQASSNKLNILSSPHILAADNKEARIEVGKEVPIVTSEYVPQDLQDRTATSRSIEYRSTGVILSVTPRINDRGLVAMEISQEVSEAQQTTTSGIQSPEISNRKAQTSLVIQDGETIVIGGLIEDKASSTRAGVPFLSSIPLIGYLFSSTKSRTEKTELIILITPHVVKNFDEAALVTREFQEKLWQVDKLLHTSEDYWKEYKRP